MEGTVSATGPRQPLTGPLLRSVSRSFYLSLGILPAVLREPLGITYLLARAADTIADADIRPAEERLALLSGLQQAIRRQDAPPPSGIAAFAEAVPHAGERELLLRLSECLDAARRLPEHLHPSVQEVLEHIIRGQTLDLGRFRDPRTIQCLPDAAALDEYAWLVAGCVGKFWTGICALQLPGAFRRPVDEMTTLGIRYGKGLQLINILRDQASDAAIGRCYLPEDELRQAGLTGPVVWPSGRWEPWHAVRRRWIGTVREYLADGRRYVEATRPVRLRVAAMLPLLIGEKTLTLLENQPPDAAPAPAKVPRSGVRRILLRAIPAAVLGRLPAAS